MSNKIKKDLTIEGLCCANCATKIEDKVGKLNGVSIASMNLINNTLSIEVEDTNRLEEVLNKTIEIVKTVEPDAIIRENIITKSEKKTLILMGLCCANCASKIETKTKNITGVKTVSLDFISKKLVLKVDSKFEVDKIVNQVIEIAKQVEPDIKVIDEETDKKKQVNHRGLLSMFRKKGI